MAASKAAFPSTLFAAAFARLAAIATLDSVVMALVLAVIAPVSTTFAAVVALLTVSIIFTTSMIERKPSITEKKACTEAVIFCHAVPVPSRVSTKLETLSPIP